jgi:pimeloyl-ACP methyl ester carboxylesterase
MTLLCPGINGYPWPDDDPPELVAEWERCHAETDVDGLAKLLGGLWFAQGSDDYLDEQVRHTVELDFSPAAEFEQKNPEQWSRLESLTIPTTVIAGELDPADSLQASIDLAARIPGATLVRLAADHVPQYREPEVVAEAVLATADRAN